MNSDWAKNLAARKKSELEAKRLQQEKDLNDRKLLDTNADKMWVEVRRAAAACCKELNHSMGSDYIKFEGASYHNSFTLITPETIYTVTSTCKPGWFPLMMTTTILSSARATQSVGRMRTEMCCRPKNSLRISWERRSADFANGALYRIIEVSPLA